MARKLRISPWRWVFIILLVAGVSAATYMVSKSRMAQVNTGAQELYSTGTHQMFKADIPLETMPDQLLGGLILLSAEQLATIPYVDGFQWPCGTAGGAMMYDAQPFGTLNTKRGGYHTGMDINGIGGNNSDLGEPVRAAARGLVIYTGQPSASWGNVVVLAHRLPGTNRIIQTLYAHLQEKGRNVILGQVVSRGEQIGTIGTANDHYLAHLHFEAIESRCTEAGMPGYHIRGTMNRLDPADLLQQYPAPDLPDAYGEIRRIRIHEAAAGKAAAAATPPSGRPQKPSPQPQQPQGTLLVNPSQYL